MSLRHVLLVYLGSGGASGSDIVKGFQHTFGYLWNASFQQIYRDLGKLHEDGLLDCATVDNAPRPPRKVYSLNDAGRQAMQAWLRKPVPVPKLNDAFLVKIASVHLQDPDVLAAELSQRQAQFSEALGYLKQKRAVFESLPAEVLEKFLGVYLTLKRGIGMVESWLLWSDEVADMLAARKWLQITPDDLRVFLETVQGDNLPHPGDIKKGSWVPPAKKSD